MTYQREKLVEAVDTMQRFVDEARREATSDRTDTDAACRVAHAFSWGVGNAWQCIEAALMSAERERMRQ